jgi:HPt (histidine-containing phosphotransfer) domain-containing protein
MDDYVGKPIRVEALVEALSKSRPLATIPEEDEPALAAASGRDGTAPKPVQIEAEGNASAAPGEEGPDITILDPAALGNLLSVVGGEFAYLAELIDSFLEDAPQLLAELEAFIGAGDAVGARRVAHSLKSNGADFGATTFSHLCKELETLGRSGALNGAQELGAQIVAEYEKVAAALTAVRRNGSLSGRTRVAYVDDTERA